MAGFALDLNLCSSDSSLVFTEVASFMTLAGGINRRLVQPDETGFRLCKRHT